MYKTTLTISQQEFIKASYLLMSSSKIAAQLSVGKTMVWRYLKENKLKAPKELVAKWKIETRLRPFTPAEDAYLVQHIETLSIKKLSATMHRTSAYISNRLRQLGLGHIAAQKAAASRIKTGQVSFNKGKKQLDYLTPEQIAKSAHTRFKKGNLPHNTKEGIGHISIRTDKRINRKTAYIKLAHGKWMPLSQYIWEQAHGKQPPKTCISFIDGNSLNCDISNLQLISMAENARRNKTGFLNYPADVRDTIQIINKLNKIINQKK